MTWEGLVLYWWSKALVDDVAGASQRVAWDGSTAAGDALADRAVTVALP